MQGELANAILYGLNTNYGTWLAQEAADLATEFAGLDEIHHLAIATLAMLAALVEADAKRISNRTGIQEADIGGHLNALCEFGFAEETLTAFCATQLGVEASVAVGKRMITRERYETKRRLEELEVLYRAMD